jgi:hypothetical protein
VSWVANWHGLTRSSAPGVPSGCRWFLTRDEVRRLLDRQAGVVAVGRWRAPWQLAIHETEIQCAIRAAYSSGIAKPATLHSLRHYPERRIIPTVRPAVAPLPRRRLVQPLADAG